MKYEEIASAVWNRCKVSDLEIAYTTVLTLYGAMRVAEVTENETLLKEVLQRLEPFWRGKVPYVAGHYGKYDYRFGGNASAWALYHDYLPAEAEKMIVATCEDLIHLQPRLDGKIFCQKSWFPPHEWKFRWIDTVFGVCPFLLWTGLKCHRPDFIDEAAAQMRYHHELLYDPVRQLYHQAANAQMEGIAQSYWSRGLGWGLHALADLSEMLPSDHKEYPAIRKWFKDVIDGCLAVQDPAGMWHQAMDDAGTFAETSGTGLILYALGKGIRTGYFTEEKYLAAFKRGIEALSGYIGIDGSVHNCCGGCCSPGVCGSAADYNSCGWNLNDHHAFGGPLLAYSEAMVLRRTGVLTDGE